MGKANGQNCSCGHSPCQVVFTRLQLHKDRKSLEQKDKSHQVGKEKGKHKEETVEKMVESYMTLKLPKKKKFKRYC